MFKSLACFIVLLLAGITTAHAQTNIDLGGIAIDATQAVEVVSDSLSVDQDTGRAIFTGNVVVVQGDLRLSAGTIEVIYTEVSGDISELIASGGVTFVTANEAAESKNAVYSLATNTLTMTGDVLLTQGASAVSAQKMVVNTQDGTAIMEGLVRTVLQQGNN